MTDSVVIVGQVGAPFGVRGWVHIDSYTSPQQNILSYRPWLVKSPDAHGEWAQLTELEARRHHEGVIARLFATADRTAAQSLRSLEIGVHRSSLPSLDDGEFYWIDLVGTRVVNTRGSALGTIGGFIEAGTQSVMQVLDGANERLIPFVSEIVVDAQPGDRVVVDWEEDW